MKITQNQIDTYLFADKNSARDLDVICLTKNKTVATNSFYLIELDNPEELKELTNKEIILKTKKIKKIKIELQADINEDGIISVDNTEKYNCDIIKTFPKYQNIIPNSVPTISVNFNPKLLTVLLDYLNKQKCEIASIELRPNPAPIVIKAKLMTQQNVTMLLMPILY